MIRASTIAPKNSHLGFCGLRSVAATKTHSVLTRALWLVCALAAVSPAHAAIAFRGASSVAVISGDPTAARPVGTVMDDVMVAAVAIRPASTTISAPAGWTLIVRVDNVNANDNALAVYYKVAGAAEPTTYLWNLTNTNTGAVVGITSFSGVDPTNPIDVFGGAVTPNGFEHAAPSITPTKSGAMIVSWHGYCSSNPWTPPTGMTEAVDLSSDVAATQYGIALSGNFLLQASAAPTGALTALVSNDSNNDVGNGVAVALRAGNVAPTATNLSAADTYTEDLAVNLTDIVISDPDSAVTATLTLSIPSAGTLSTATSGAVTSTYVAATGVWTASGPVANVNTLLASVTFSPAPNASVSFSLATSVSDGIAPAIAGTKPLTGQAVNDAPTATNLSAPETYTEDQVLDLVDVVVTDLDSAAVTVTLALSSPTAGAFSTATSGAVSSTYKPVTGVWTASGAIANVNALLAGVRFTPAANSSASLTIATSVSDNVAAAVTGSKPLSGVAANDAPTATNLSAAESYTEDTALNLVDIVVADIDTAAVTVTLTVSNPAAGTLSTSTSGAVTSTYVAGTGVWTASGAIANVNALLAGVTFTPAPNSVGAFTIASSVSDGTHSLTGTKTVTGVAINDAPTATNLSAAESYTEDTARDLADIVVTDLDSAAVTVTLTLSSPTAGTLSTGTAGAVTSTFVTATGVWTASGALANVNTLLAGVLFTPAANSSANVTIITSVSDGVAQSVTGSKSLTGTAVNDAPTATNLSAAETYTEATTLNLVDIVVSDVDSPVVTVTLTLSNPTVGTLSTGTSGAVTATYAAGTGVWTASGAISNVNTLLAAVAFTPAPTVNVNFAIAVSVTDAVAPPVTGAKPVSGSAVNDPPTATNLSAAETYTEDTVRDLVDIVVSDIDSVAATVTLTLSNPGSGVLSTGTAGAVTSSFVPATGVWTASGAIGSVNTLLAGVSFTPAANSSAGLTILVSVSDGVAASITGSKIVTGTAVNDAPTATNLSAAESYTEDASVDLTDVVVTDIDSATVTVTLTLSSPGAGSLSTSTSGSVTSIYSAGTGVWTASGPVSNVNAVLAAVAFNPANNASGTVSVSTSVSDDVAAAITGQKTLSGTAVNDAPTATSLSAAESYTEDVSTNLVDIVIADVDSALVTATLTLTDPAAGALTTGTSSAVTSTWSVATGVWSASGALADVNVLLAQAAFVPTSNFNGAVTITTRVSDGVAPAITGTKNVTGAAVNDAPTATNLSATETYTEDTPIDLVEIVVGDVDTSILTVTLTISDPAVGSLSTATSGAATATYSAGTGVWSASGAIADLNLLLAGLRFTPAPGVNANFSVVTTVSDGAASPVTGNKVVAGIGVNDAPTATSLSAGEVYTEDTALDLVDIVVVDLDSPVVSASLTLSSPAAGALSTLTVGTTTATFAAQQGVWSATGPVAEVNELLAAVTFVPALDQSASFTIATSVTDGESTPVTGTKPASGIPVNDAPTATGLSEAETFTEDQAIDLVDVVVEDPDSSVNVTLTLSPPTAGALSTGSVGAVLATYDASSGVWSAFGPVADVNTLLSEVVFTPAANGNGPATIATSVSDGVAAAATGKKALTGLPINDPPIATNISTPETYTEDAPLDLVDIAVTDVDDESVTVTVTLSSAAAGTLTTGTAGDVTSTYDPASGTWTASGAVAEVSTLLASLTFVPTPNASADVTLAVVVSDGHDLVSGTKALAGLAVTDCSPTTCQNGGACEDVTTGFACECADGFEGTNCETNLDDCSGDPCQNGGLCADGDATFTCTCLLGFEGTTCGTNIDDCVAAPCLNGGTCVDGVATVTCGCAPGFDGDTCAINVDDCVTNPCMNGGACVDGVASFDCACPNGYTGALCGDDVDECTSAPCENDGECTNGTGTFECTCAAGFKGATCETDVDDCEPAPCQNGGTCTDEVNGFTCACADGFAGVTCTSDTFDCESNPCQNGATCTDTPDGRTCVCPAGYNGESCEFDIDDCTPNPCLNDATCTDAVNGFECACQPGYSGTTCENFDECLDSPCDNGGTCVDGPSAFTCVCAKGYEGEQCETELDECAAGPCLNGGSCADGVGAFTCTCAAGYEGATCGAVVDVCAIGNGGCAPSTTCTSTAAGPVCGACPEGTTGGTGESGCPLVDDTVISVAADDSSGCLFVEPGRAPSHTPWLGFTLLAGLAIAGRLGRRRPR